LNFKQLLVKTLDLSAVILAKIPSWQHAANLWHSHDNQLLYPLRTTKVWRMQNWWAHLNLSGIDVSKLSPRSQKNVAEQSDNSPW